MRQRLIINGINVPLPSDFKVTIKRTNPLFNEEGDFSFPFSLSLSENHELVRSASDPHGRFSLRNLNNLDCEYWFDGILLFRGYTEVNDTVEFKDTISINFNSGIKTITERIKDMNAQDVSVERIQLGYACTGMRFTGDEESEFRTFTKGIYTSQAKYCSMPSYDTGYINAPVKNALYTFDDASKDNYALNVSGDSASKAYCNTRLALDIENENRPLILDYNRRDAAPCMFVLYWLKRLFHDLDIAVVNEFEQMEDMKRLAFLSTFPKYDVEDWPAGTDTTGFVVKTDAYTNQRTLYASWDKWANILPQYDFGEPFGMHSYFFHGNLDLYVHYDNIGDGNTFTKSQSSLVDAKSYYNDKSKTAEYGFQPAFLSSRQYPDVDAKKIVDDLHDIFGLRIIYNTVTNEARVVYIKDIISGVTAKTLPGEFAPNPIVTRNINDGIIISYGNDVDGQATNLSEGIYDYTMPTHQEESAGMLVKQSASVTYKQTFTSTDAKTYYDAATGNAIRIMVDEGSEEWNQGAEPFEVGQYNAYRAFVTDEDGATTVTANFKPVDVMDVYRFNNGTRSFSQSDLAVFVDAQQTTYDTEAIFVESEDGSGSDVDTSMMYETFENMDCQVDKFATVSNAYYYFDTTGIVMQNNTEELIMQWRKWFLPLVGIQSNNLLLPEIGGSTAFQFSLLLKFATNNTESCDMSTQDSPLQQWQDGGNYVLGFMRGAGNDSGIEYDRNTYTDDKTRCWQTVVGTPTFTADSVDQFGNVFDYNGSEEGGVDQSQRLSLKLDARKVYGYDEDGNPDFYQTTNDTIAKRGVVTKMLDKYLYFQTHSKTITHKAHVAIGQVMNIDWCSNYNLQQCVGFINSVQLELSESGVGQSTIEQYVVE